MVKVIIVDKGCNLKSSDIKDFNKEMLFKKCNFRKNDNFSRRATWKMNDDYFVSLYAKDKGRANSENKYDLPPPIDKELYYGTMLLVKHCYKDLTNETADDFEINEWNKLYEKLFGGFEDLGEEDSYSEEEEIPEHLKTKQGYSKEDGFVVSDDDEEDEDYIPEEESEDEAHTSTDDAEEEDGMGQESELDVDEDEEEEEDEDEEEEYDSDDLGSELSEESYIDSD